MENNIQPILDKLKGLKELEESVINEENVVSTPLYKKTENIFKVIEDKIKHIQNYLKAKDKEITREDVLNIKVFDVIDYQEYFPLILELKKVVPISNDTVKKYFPLGLAATSYKSIETLEKNYGFIFKGYRNCKQRRSIYCTINQYHFFTEAYTEENKINYLNSIKNYEFKTFEATKKNDMLNLIIEIKKEIINYILLNTLKVEDTILNITENQKNEFVKKMINEINLLTFFNNNLINLKKIKPIFETKDKTFKVLLKWFLFLKDEESFKEFYQAIKTNYLHEYTHKHFIDKVKSDNNLFFNVSLFIDSKKRNTIIQKMMENLKTIENYSFKRYFKDEITKEINKELKHLLHNTKFIEFLEKHMVDESIFKLKSHCKEHRNLYNFLIKEQINIIIKKVEQESLNINSLLELLKDTKNGMFNLFQLEIKKMNNEKLIIKNELNTLSKIKNIGDFYGVKTEMFERKFHLFYGPTNSGKTYAAIQMLKELKPNEKGIYLAPLRLLAREIYDTLKSDNCKVNLITGEEIIEEENAMIQSSTIEMLDLTQVYDVAIIDEAQMISDEQRGNAWMRAILGIKAKKIIVLSSPVIVEFLKELITNNTETYETQKFERFNPLEKIDTILKYKNLKKGDAVIAFSIQDVERLRYILKNNYGFNVATIYGSMPPSTKVETAKLFNNGDIDIIVATDAIGMGLNLNIKRIIFSTVFKYNGYNNEPLNIELFKQIIGRAGRYGINDKGYFGLLNDTENYYFDKDYNQEYFDGLSDEIQTQYFIKNGYYFPEISHLKPLERTLKINNIFKLLETYKKHFSCYSKDISLISFYDILAKAQIIENTIPLESLENKYKYLFAPITQTKYGFVPEELEIFKKMLLKQKFSLNLKKEISYLSKEQLISEAKKIQLYTWLYLRNYGNEEYLKEYYDYYERISVFIMQFIKK